MSNLIKIGAVLILLTLSGCGTSYSLAICNNTGYDIDFYLNGSKHHISDKDYWIGDYISKTGKMYVGCNGEYWKYPVIYRMALPHHRSLTLGRPIDLQVEPDGRIYQVKFKNYRSFKPEYVGDYVKPSNTRFPLEPEIVDEFDVGEFSK